MSTSPLYERPSSGEYDPYFERYISRVPTGPIFLQLQRQLEETLGLFHGLPATKGDFAYAPGKWTLKEVVGHICDTERIMAYRALRFARNDQTALPGFDETLYVPHGGFGTRTLKSLLDEFRLVRGATVALFENLPVEAFVRRGMANETPASVRALGYVIAGHELHHVGILKEKYLAG